jgi:hypothetical protein
MMYFGTILIRVLLVRHYYLITRCIVWKILLMTFHTWRAIQNSKKAVTHVAFFQGNVRNMWQLS